MGIKAAHQDTRLRDAEAHTQVVMQNADHAFQMWCGDGGADLLQGNMSGGERDTQPIREQHHNDLGRIGDFGKKFGVSGKGDAGVVDHRLMHGASHKGGELFVLTAVHRDTYTLQDIGGIGGIDLAAGHGFA